MLEQNIQDKHTCTHIQGFLGEAVTVRAEVTV